MKSKIRVSCGKSVDKSVLSAGGEVWYRARLELGGSAPIPDVEATVIELWQEGEKVPLAEYLTLTMFPGMRHALDSNLKTLSEGRPEFVHVIRVADTGKANFPLKIIVGQVAHDTLLSPGHTYGIVVAIFSPSNRTDICTFEFDWTGDPEALDLRLMSVMPPKSGASS